MERYTTDEWRNLTTHLYKIILSDFENIPPDHLPQRYPSLVVMYEFFRLMRGEGFSNIRSYGMDGRQNEIYKMEDDIQKKLEELSKKLDKNDPMVEHYLDLMKKSFDL